MIYFICILIGYLFGSIPCGYLYALSKGINIFEVGSKSPGSTNVGRVLGKKASHIVFIFDIAKSVIAILLMHILLINGFLDGFIPKDLLSYSNHIDLMNHTTIEAIVILYTGLGSIIGHNYPFTTKFRGGKGISCTCGTYLYFCWYHAIVLYLIHKLVKHTTHYVSVASITAVICVFLDSLIFSILHIKPYNFDKAYLVLPATFMMMVLGIFTHRSNIKRLLEGKENKI